MDQFNQQPNMPQQPSTPPMGAYGGGEEHKSSVGPIVGSIIVVLVIVLGGLYLYGSQFSQRAAEEGPAAADIEALPDQEATALENQGVTDSLSEIEADIETTNVDNLDADIGNIGGELNSI